VKGLIQPPGAGSRPAGSASRTPLLAEVLRSVFAGTGWAGL